ncbi:MAG TPA: transposase [Pyrinomonadaceae bacterium]|nr:transposase [Pyrinomonadaceae bacterium]
MDELAEIYSDYLISSFGLTTATGLSKLLDGEISHDKITRFLSGEAKTSKDLWQFVKPLIREIETDDACLIIDDSIEEKPYTDENEIVCWHYDHSKQLLIKGINFLSCLYQTADFALPIGFDLIRKTEFYLDPKDGKEKRRSPISKNELARSQIEYAVKNKVKFRFVLFDVWFAAVENLRFILKQHKHFICPLKSNRKIASSKEDKLQGRWQKLETLEIETDKSCLIYLEGLEVPVLLIKQVFTNEDGKTIIQYLISSDLNLSIDDITTNYHKRWRVEEYHKSLKQNVSLERSPTQTETTQTNHFFAALCGYIKLERLKIKTKQNHFALKSKLYLKALMSAFQTLQELNQVHLCVR